MEETIVVLILKIW